MPVTGPPEYRIHTRAVAELRLGFLQMHGLEKKDCPFFHCPNESAVPVQYRSKLASLGLSAGVSDLVIVHPILEPPEPNGVWSTHYPGAALELKAPGKKASKRQEAWLTRWGRAGFATACRAGHAKVATQLWLWGYISAEQSNRWVDWARERDPEAL